MYPIRAQHWVQNPKYGNYEDWDTVLVAPVAFVSRHAAGVAKFGAVITHEEIAEHVDAFRY